MSPPPRAGLALLWADGDVRLTHAGRDDRLVAGDLALIDCALPIGLTGNAESSAKLLDLRAHTVTIRHEQRSRCLGSRIDGRDPLAALVKRMWAIGQDAHQLGVDDALTAARLIDAIGDLAGKLLARSVDRGVPDYQAAMLQRAETLIAARSGNPSFNAAALAKEMRISRRHLSSLFASVGITTTLAITADRLAKAKALLSEPANRHAQIASVAAACGFDDQNYFARCFRKNFGVTPRTFRAAIQN